MFKVFEEFQAKSTTYLIFLGQSNYQRDYAFVTIINFYKFSSSFQFLNYKMCSKFQSLEKNFQQLISKICFKQKEKQAKITKGNTSDMTMIKSVSFPADNI